ncbi:hypothetical protein I6F37_39745, partial [Bradyrhizobium sp. NBAIM08]|nr:hypothetical protein [Bradyrhizobium sp. NBAIM08]
HLVRCGEILGAMLLTWHNVAYYQRLMATMRDAVAAGTFAEFAAAFRRDHQQGDIEAWNAEGDIVEECGAGGGVCT